MQMSELNQLGLPCGAGWWTMIYVWPTFFAGHNCNCFSSRWICLHWFYVVLIRPRIFQTVEHWVFQVEKLKQQNLSWQNLSWPLQRHGELKDSWVQSPDLERQVEMQCCCSKYLSLGPGVFCIDLFQRNLVYENFLFLPLPPKSIKDVAEKTSFMSSQRYQLEKYDSSMTSLL